MTTMKSAGFSLSRTWLMVLPLVAAIPAATPGVTAEAPGLSLQGTSLQGTWVMTSAYEILADGTRTTTYGEHPAVC